MNDNPTETPNPLNPMPGAAPGTAPNTDPAIAQAPQDNTISGNMPASSMPTAAPQMPQAAASTPSTEQPTGANILEEVQMSETVTVNPAPEIASQTAQDQAAMPTEQEISPMAQAEPVKPKKKTGLIVCIIVLCLVLLGAGAVAAYMLLKPAAEEDRVATAMQKLMSGGVAENVAVDGTIELAIAENDGSVPFSKVSIDLDSYMIANTLTNATNANITITGWDNSEYTANFNEVYAESGDLYFKLEASDFVDYLIETIQNETVTEVAEGEISSNENGTTAVDFGLLGFYDTIDGEWLRLSVQDLNDLTGGVVSESPLSCLVNLVDNVNKDSSSAIELYNQYPFLSSTTDGVAIASKQFPVYQVLIDQNSLTSYINSIQSSTLMNNLYSCLGAENNVSISENDITTIVENLPEIYVEIDDDSHFTRLYLQSEIKDSACLVDEPTSEIAESTDCEPVVIGTLTTDLSFDYPITVNIAEPIEYRDFSEVIQEILSSMFELPDYGTIPQGTNSN